MSDYLLTNKALDDLTEIWNYTYDEWPESQADKYYFLLLDSCQVIAENPNKGKRYNIIRNDLLGFNQMSKSFFTELSLMIKLKW